MKDETLSSCCAVPGLITVLCAVCYSHSSRRGVDPRPVGHGNQRWMDGRRAETMRWQSLDTIKCDIISDPTCRLITLI